MQARDRSELEQSTTPVGRKLDTVRRAARQLFLDQGFSATSMDAVAKVAGVSKATLYAYFPSKEALFESLIVAECESLQQDLPAPKLSAGLRQALRQFARQYLDVFMEQKEVTLVRIIANESGRFPELSELFYQSGPLATAKRLALFLDEAKKKGLIEFEDSMEAASQFLSLVRGELPLRVILGLTRDAEETVHMQIESGLAFFLKACRSVRRKT